MKNHKDIIKGGKGDKLNPSNVDKKELEMGIKEEMEHTNDKELAKEIALDHLAEDPKYYSKLKTIFKEKKIMKLTKEQFLIKYITEKLQKVSGKKVILKEMDEDERAYLKTLTPEQKLERKKRMKEEDLKNAIPIEKLKKNQIFRFPGSNKEYEFAGFDRSSGKYAFGHMDDISAYGEKKKGTLVVIDN